MNVKLLRKVKKHILAEPKRLYMASYMRFRGKEQDAIGRPFAKCGTAACIGGWACILSLKKSPKEIYAQHVVGDEAQELLGLDFDERFTLFEPGQWPAEFQAGCTGDGKKETAKIAAARIEHFIKTEGRE